MFISHGFGVALTPSPLGVARHGANMRLSRPAGSRPPPIGGGIGVKGARAWTMMLSATLKLRVGIGLPHVRLSRKQLSANPDFGVGMENWKHVLRAMKLSAGPFSKTGMGIIVNWFSAAKLPANPTSGVGMRRRRASRKNCSLSANPVPQVGIVGSRRRTWSRCRRPTPIKGGHKLGSLCSPLLEIVGHPRPEAA